MKYSIEIGKIVEGALKHDQLKVTNYTKQLITKLEEDGEKIAANKFSKLLSAQINGTITPMDSSKILTIPLDGESRTALADIVYFEDNDANIILSKTNNERINEFVLNYKCADKLSSAGIDISNTILLYGPPGCGKTGCAYFIAKELHLPLVIARLDSMISSYLGTTSKNIRILFEFAQKVPCVLFLDEFDAIAKARDDTNELGELKRVVNTLLQNVDMLNNDSILVAATNHEQLLDSAVWRRFDYKVKIELPDTESIIKMIDLFPNSSNDLSDKEKYELAIAFGGLSGADIKEIITKALRDSILKDEKLNKIKIYDEIFIFNNIIPLNCSNDKSVLQIKTKFLRDVNKDVFSLQVIADILGSSKTTIQRLTKVE